MKLLVRAMLVAMVAMVLAVAAVGCGGRAAGLDEAAVAANNRGVALMGRFDYAAALEVFAGLVAEHPDHPELLVNQAIATLNRQQEGDEEAAVALADRALAADPGHLRAHYVRGLAALYLGRADEAHDAFSRVVAGDPDDADAAFFLGQCLMQRDEVEAALAQFERARALDPNLRSAAYRAFQALQRLGRRDEAMARLAEFQALEGNPQARLVEFKYTRMGEKGSVSTVDPEAGDPAPPPSGPLFAEGRPVAGAQSATRVAGAPASITAADVDGDGRLDLYLVGVAAGTLLLRGRDGGGFAAAPEHPLSGIPEVRAALWGDLDNDGLVDLVLGRRGPDQLWLQRPGGSWEEVAATAGVAGGDAETVDGALADLDHDGDLDLWLARGDGPDEVWGNDRTGGFRPLAADRGLAGPGAGSRQVVVADLDGDRVLDTVVLGRGGPARVYRNRLTWGWSPATGWGALEAASPAAAVTADADADGRVELYTLAPDGGLDVWSAGTARRLARVPATAAPRLAVADVDGDGRHELVVGAVDGWRLVDPGDGRELGRVAGGGDEAWTLAPLDPERGPSLVAWAPGAAPRVLDPGPGRWQFLSATLTGREQTADSLRSNASGLGARAAFRVGGRWTVEWVLRADSGPGQSLAPLSVGLGGAARADFVAVDWPDGVFQSELDLAAGSRHVIAETQRQLSSCPVLFAFDGERMAFVSDVLGVGGLGYAVAPGEVAPPRPWERFLLPEGLPASRDGRLELIVAEPMEEAVYLDAARLVAWELPPGWAMALDERMATGPPEPTGEPLFFRREALPVAARNERGEDVTAAVRTADLAAAPVGALDHRFIGRLAGTHVLELEFAGPLAALGPSLALVADGWVEYPYSSTTIAAWQAGADYRPPTLEARDGDGRWRPLLPAFGYPAGMPRRMAVPLPRLPAGCGALRLVTNQEVYWDRLAVVAVEPCPEARRLELELERAELVEAGFPARTTAAQRLPGYDHARRAPLADLRVQPGWYSRFGDVRSLVAELDDALAIFAAGEEVVLAFAAPPPPAAGCSRRLVLELDGWCKDMDLHTADGRTLGPLPAAGRGAAARERLHAELNTRWADGTR